MNWVEALQRIIEIANPIYCKNIKIRYKSYNNLCIIKFDSRNGNHTWESGIEISKNTYNKLIKNLPPFIEIKQ